LTVYNDNFAVVKERRSMDFKKGESKCASPTHGSPRAGLRHFKGSQNPDDIQILEQNYEAIL